MPWGANQWLRVTKEATYGTYNASADPADVAWFQLIGDNAFSMRAVPQRVVIRSADGGNRRVKQVAARKVVTGSLSTAWYPSQSLFLLDAALKLTANDLPSYTLDYFDTTAAKRHLGAKCQTLELPGTAQGDYVPARVTWVASTDDDVTLAQPAYTVFPTEVPYEHVESRGGLSIASTVMAKYSSLGIKVANVLAPTWDEAEFITNLYYAGRDVDLTLRRQYVDSTMRAAFRAQTPLAITAAWTRVGGKVTTFDLKSANYVAELSDDLPLGGASYQDMTIQCFFDGAAGADAGYAVTDYVAP